MITLKKNGNNVNYGYKESIVDTAADLSEINLDKCAQGSIAFVVDTSKAMILDGSGTWVDYKGSFTL